MLPWESLFEAKKVEVTEDPEHVRLVEQTRDAVMLVLAGCQTDEQCMEAMLVHHQALVWGGKLAQFLDIVPRDNAIARAYVIALFKAVVQSTLVPLEGEEKQWKTILSMFRGLPLMGLELRKAYQLLYQSYFGRMANEEPSVLTDLYKRVLDAIAKCEDRNIKNQLYGLACYARMFQIKTEDPDEAFHICNLGVGFSYDWYKHLKNDLKLGDDDFRVLDAAVKTWQTWHTADLLFGAGEKFRMALSPSIRDLSMQYPDDPRFLDEKDQ